MEYHSIENYKLTFKTYKSTFKIFRRLSCDACFASQTFSARNVPPNHHSARVVRQPLSPLAHIWSAVIRNTAAANIALQDSVADWRFANLDLVYAEKDLQIIRENNDKIPAGALPLMQGHIMHSVMMQAAFWKKCESLIWESS